MPNSDATDEINLGWDPGRVLFGLSRIGYTPSSAVCDLIDNAVRAKAEHVRVLIHKEREDLSDRRRNNVREYVIIDDGHGMNEAGLQDALKLGSPEEEYEEGALAKFGLGLKAAALSQGKRLELISAPKGGGPFRKRVLSLPAVQEQGRYFASHEDLTDDDRALIDEYLPGGHGTIVRVAEVRKENHPSVRSTVEDLTYKVGVIYYYFIEEGLHIEIDGEDISSFDVLFTDEADENGKLNEHQWNGKSVRWIQQSKDILLDAEADVEATVEVTQLPYPPIFGLEEGGNSDADIRNHYRIEAGNYGFYVYRNKRLISWAERFDIIPQHGKLYGFRGRLLIDSSADDAFNIDVKKASITLSDDAARTLSDYSAEYKSKSRKAWQRGIDLRKEREGSNPNQRANRIADDYTPPDSLPGEGLPTKEEAQEHKERDADIQREMREQLRKEAADRKREKGEAVSEEDVTEKDLENTLREEANPSAYKIFRASRVKDNALWEPYHDAQHEGSVRIDKHHRFGRLIYQDNYENADLQILFELILLQLGQAEIYAQRQLTDYDRETVRDVIASYRRFTSEFLAGMCRKLDDDLPRSEG